VSVAIDTGTASIPPSTADENRRASGQGSPLERLGTTEDIAKTVDFMVSEEAGWVNGQTLRVNGSMA
jgi:3-oxoacyl-[acyl-carrier protein] reductase